jgi:hypothetical protein
MKAILLNIRYAKCLTFCALGLSLKDRGVVSHDVAKVRLNYLIRVLELMSQGVWLAGAKIYRCGECGQNRTNDRDCSQAFVII